jgi:cytochrome c oxidase subunit 3
MAHAKNHDYHILNPSIWPFLGRGRLRHAVRRGALDARQRPWLFLMGFVGVLYVMFGWWADVVAESQAGRSHAGGADRPALRLHPVHHVRGDVLRGVVLELLQARHLPDELRGRVDLAAAGSRPSIRWHLPLINTLILLCRAAR